MEFSSGRLESSSRIQQRDSGTATDAWPRQRRRKVNPPNEETSVDQENLTENPDDEREIHRFDDIA